MKHLVELCVHKLGNNDKFVCSLYYYEGELKLNSVALVRTRTIQTERPPPVGEASVNM